VTLEQNILKAFRRSRDKQLEIIGFNMNNIASLDRRLLIFLICGFFAIIAFALNGPIQQNLNYHLFADKRAWFGVKNFLDVWSNFLFLVIGSYGLFHPKRGDLVAQKSWMIFFLGVIFVAPGSAYYHLNPNNQTLVWDRLPMTVAFSAGFTAILVSQFTSLKERVLLVCTLSFGVVSVLYWAVFDDLRIYFLAQILPFSAMLLFVLTTKSHRQYRVFILASGFLYLLAKIVELNDLRIFYMTSGLISGHTLKHIFAAFAVLPLAQMLQRPASFES
jgi:hypothetical protein